MSLAASRKPAATLDKPSFATLAGNWLVRNRVRLSVIVFTLIIVAEIILGVRPLDVLDVKNPLVATGLALVLLGVAIRTWAAGTLRKREVLVTEGPYRFVRHPLFLGSFLMIVGFCVLMGMTINLLLLALPVLLAYIFAIRHEEHFLGTRFGAEWAEYASRVPALLPWRLPRAASFSWTLRQWLVNREYQAMLASALGIGAIYAWHAWQTTF